MRAKVEMRDKSKKVIISVIDEIGESMKRGYYMLYKAARGHASK